MSPGTPDAVDLYQQAVPAVAKAKSWVWEVFGEAMKQKFQLTSKCPGKLSDDSGGLEECVWLHPSGYPVGGALRVWDIGLIAAGYSLPVEPLEELGPFH